MQNNIQKKALELYKILDKFRKNPNQLVYDPSIITEQLQYFISKELPIKFVLPALHGKVTNPNCVFDHLPDLGEYLGVSNFVNLCNEIQCAYKPGCELLLLHEGHFYVDTVLMHSDEHIDAYMQKIYELIKPYPYIKSMGLKEFFPNHETNAERRKQFILDFVPNEAETELLIKKEKRYAKLFGSYKKIYEVAYKDILFQHLSKNQAHIQARPYALQQLQFYIGFGRMVNQFFYGQHYIRLSSIYKDPSVKDQVAINYLSDTHHLSTPSFHCVVKYKNGNYDFIKRKDAIAKNYIVDDVSGYKYFKEV